MRVLVVHDRREVATAIQQLILKELACPIDVVGDVFAAKDHMRQRSYDLAVIDLTLPVMAGLSETRLEYVEALLNEIFEGDELKTPGDLIGISRDGDAVDSIRSSIGQHLLAVITEDPDDAWHQRLIDKVRYLKNSRRGRLLAATTVHEVDAFIITALDKEFRPYRELLELRPCDEFTGASEFSFVARDGHAKRGVLISAGRSGQVPSASLAQAVITQLRPRVAIMTGFCGGVAKRVALGDVAMFTSAAAWDYGKWEEGVDGNPPQFRARPDALNIPVGRVADIVRALADQHHVFNDAAIGAATRMLGQLEKEPEAKAVGAGSGSAVVTSEVILSRIVDLNENIYAIDMESYGFYHACLNTSVVRPDFVCIKGVADHCNGEKNSKWHEPCSFLSATLALDVLRNRYDFSE
jgi:nucleoside phosphorylase